MVIDYSNANTRCSIDDVMLDYIYNILYSYITIGNLLVLCSIVLPVLVCWVFWSGALRQKVFQVLGDLNTKYKGK